MTKKGNRRTKTKRDRYAARHSLLFRKQVGTAEKFCAGKGYERSGSFGRNVLNDLHIRAASRTSANPELSNSLTGGVFALRAEVAQQRPERPLVAVIFNVRVVIFHVVVALLVHAIV